MNSNSFPNQKTFLRFQIPIMLPLKSKMKVPNRKNLIPKRNQNLGHGELGKELRTFQTVGSRSESEDIAIVAIDDEMSEDDSSELDFELSQKVINLDALKRVVSRGHLDGVLRPIVWKLLLGYLPIEKDAWEVELKNNRLRYAELKAELLLNPSALLGQEEKLLSLNNQDKESDVDGPLCRHEIYNGDHPLNLGKASIWRQYFKDAEIAVQIDRDLQRTHPEITFFSGDFAPSKINKEAMRNILLLFAKLNPAIGYVQGMNEVLSPLYYVFRTDRDERNASHAEADSFGCFVRLLSDSLDHFCQQMDNSSVGILATLSELSEILKANDEELWHHLENCKVKVQFYAFRWITLLLTQEFEFHLIMKIWDFLLSNPTGVQEMLLRVCCSMLLNVRHELLNGDFASILKLLQHYPQTNIDNILRMARILTPTAYSSYYPV